MGEVMWVAALASAIVLASSPVSRAVEAPSASMSRVFVDPRDAERYRIVTIGDQEWMAENLRFASAGESRCYEDEAANCERFGRLYRWPAAVEACPERWRLPSEDDWQHLERHLGVPEAELDEHEHGS